MSTNPRQQARLGDLVVAVFDGAAQYSTDARVVARLAVLTVAHMLQHGPAASRSRQRLLSGNRGRP